MSKIFISYAREDLATAQRLRSDLIEMGMSPWLDIEDLLPGSRWKPAIEKAIRSSDFFVALLSSQSVNKRGYVQREVREAIDVLRELPDDRVFLIPVRLEDCKPKVAELEDLHWVDMFPDYFGGLSRIVSVLRGGEKSGYVKPLLSPPHRAERAPTISTVLAPSPTSVLGHAHFANSVWRETIESGSPPEVEIHFRANGSFTFRYNSDEIFRLPSEGSKWSINDGLLELDWNGGFCIDTFILPSGAPGRLEGVQSVGNKPIVFDRLT